MGSGCPNCQMLEAQAKKAVEELGLKDAQVEHIYEIDKIIEMGITLTPAIAFDEEIKAAGRIPSVEEIKSWLQEYKK